MDKIFELINLKQEGEYWDFKRQWHENKADLLHDIICMANNLSDNDGYIIIGIDEENDYSIRYVKLDENRKNTQKIVDFLKDKKFAGDKRPTVYVQSIECSEQFIDVIVIQNNMNTPYYLTGDYKDNEKLIKEIRAYIRKIVDSMNNSSAGVKVSTITAMLASVNTYGKYIDHIDFMGLNGSFSQFIDQVKDFEKLSIQCPPEWLNLDPETLETCIKFS